MTRTLKYAFVGAAALLGGCDDEDTSPDAVNVEPGETDDETLDPSDENGTSPSTDDDDGDDDDDDAAFIPVDDDTSKSECDLWADDCPEGEKCMPWADDGGSSWNASVCSPLDPSPDQVGDSCTVVDSPASGKDSCGPRSVCSNVNDDGKGVCVALCEGSAAAPSCGAGEICSISNEGFFMLCLPSCDPLLENCPAAGEMCLPEPAAGFICYPSYPGPNGGEQGDACEYANACEPGHVCLPSEAVPDCPAGSSSCCTEFCDLGQPECTSPKAMCSRYREDPAPGEEDIGVCVFGQAPDDDD